MWIRGPRLLYRPLRLSDVDIVTAAFEDWPDDEHGPMTIARLQASTSRWANASKAFHAPVADDSRFLYAGCILLAGDPASPLDVPIKVGVHVLDLGDPELECQNGREGVTVLQAFAADHRGKGYFSEMQVTLQRFAFEVMQLRVLRHKVLEEAAAALAHVERREKYVTLGPMPRKDDPLRTVVPGVLTAEAWREWATSHGELDAYFAYEF